MTRDDFLSQLEAELRTRGAAFERAVLASWVAAVWVLAEEDPSPARWANEYLAVSGGQGTSGPEAAGE